MKTKNLLNKKITQWLLLVAMLVGCSTNILAAGFNGLTTAIMDVNGSEKTYQISASSWTIGGSCDPSTSTLNNTTIDVTSKLVLVGGGAGGWTSSGESICGEVQYKFYLSSSSEPGYSYYGFNGYNSGDTGSSCYSGSNCYAYGKAANVDLVGNNDPGSYKLKVQVNSRQRYNGGTHDELKGPVTATVTINAYVTGDGVSKTWGQWKKMTKVSDGLYSVSVVSGKGLKFSNIENYNDGLCGNYSAGTSTGVTLSKDKDNNWVATVSSGYKDPVFYLNTSTHKVYATATVDCPTVSCSVSGNAEVVAGSSETYTATANGGTISTYAWTVPSGWNITSGSETSEITVTVGTNTGDVKCTATNSCGNSKIGTKSVTKVTQYCIKGAWDSWANCQSFNDGDVEININSTGNKNFVVNCGTDCDYKNKTITRASNSATLEYNSGYDATLTVDVPGTYTFSWNPSTKVLTVTYPDYPEHMYLKHPWGGGEWTWKEMEQGDGATYTLDDVWGDNGCNVNTTASDDGSAWIEKGNIEGSGSIDSGTNVTFTYDLSTSKLSVVAACTDPTKVQYTMATGQSFTYDTQSHQPTVTPATGAGAISSYFYSTDNSNWASTAVNVGTYYVKVNVSAGTQYCAANNIVLDNTFAITKADQAAFSIDNSSTTFCKSDAPTVITKGGSGSGAVTFSRESGTEGIEVNASTGQITANNAGTITVKATKAGDNNYKEATATKTFTINAEPAQPGTISGNASPCINATGLTYSVSDVATATGYTWTLPDGWSITSGAGTRSITATAGTAGGDIKVTADNDCDSSDEQTLAVTVKGKAISVSPTTVNAKKYTPTAITATTDGEVTWAVTGTNNYLLNADKSVYTNENVKQVTVKAVSSGTVTATTTNDGCETYATVTLTPSADTETCN